MESEVDLRVTADFKLAQEWELVLLSQGLSPIVRAGSDGFVLSVRQDQAERARAKLLTYEKENSVRLNQRSSQAIDPSALVAAGLVSILILFFHAVTTVWAARLPWVERGSADAHRLLHGEPWRAVTALTLHADVVHALSNAVGVSVFLGALTSTLGTGVGCALLLTAGAIGNLLNAYFHGDGHVSLGASTAVFGAVGVLAALAVVTRRRQEGWNRRGAWLPVAAALALLAILGTGGQRVDVWAHLFGLLAGGALGACLVPLAPQAPGPSRQWVFGSATVAVLVCSWVLALG